MPRGRPRICTPKRHEAKRLRALGQSYRAIGRQLHISEKSAWNCVNEP